MNKTNPPTLETLREHRDQILALADKHGARNVRIFGSTARGDSTTASDVDLLVDWDYSRLTEWGGVGFEMDVEQLLGYHVDVVSEKWLNPLLRDQILAEAVPL